MNQEQTEQLNNFKEFAEQTLLPQNLTVENLKLKFEQNFYSLTFNFKKNDYFGVYGFSCNFDRINKTLKTYFGYSGEPESEYRKSINFERDISDIYFIELAKEMLTRGFGYYMSRHGYKELKMENLSNKEIIEGLNTINEEADWLQKREALKKEFANIQTIQLGDSQDLYTHMYGYYPNESYFTSNIPDPITHSSKYLPYEKMDALLKKAKEAGVDIKVTKGEIQPYGTGQYKPGYSGYMGRP